MEPTLFAVLAVVSIAVVAAFSERLKLAAPLSLVVVGIGASFLPGVPHPAIAPELILAGVLPPLLYSAAVNMPVVDFRRNIRPIGGLAVLLVVMSTLGAGWLFHWLIPGIGWPAAFALGAVISPTDAVAASSVGRRLGLPPRLLTVLEGEGLVNDASALVLLRSAVAAVAGSVSVWGIVGEFGYAVVLAVGIGLAVGVVNVRVRALLNNDVLNTAISFVVPFVAFLPAEELNASGVLAVVVAGLVTGHLGPRHVRATDRIAEATNWRTVAFLLESGMFLLMGLSVQTLLDEVHDDGTGVARALLIGLAASAVVILIRVVFVAPLIAGLHREQRKAARLKPRVETAQAALQGDEPDSGVGARLRRLSPRRLRRFRERLDRMAADIEFRLTETLGWRGGVVLGWAGMRGAITLAAAQTLPAATPGRAQLVLIAYVVAITTLLAQGLTLPAVIRAARVPREDPWRLRTEYVRLMGTLAGVAESILDDPELEDADGTPFAGRVLDQVRSDTRLPAEATTGPPSQEQIEIAHQYLRLRLRVLAEQAERLQQARASGEYSSAALSRAQTALDVETARFEQLGQAERG
ncbi:MULTISPECIES: cation:proton antiporter [Amycolatopsis]|uniref:Monovalent cation:H+ antiporter, CPA1 family n=2 Tax=Amycolatopsis TaxID=1813 RepID=A0A1I3WML2_9PSEU|nr:sodium:proton antiporter [Amycolatopsis sacchari]SFK07706.1 monovalent cation:H+ antiporter, CPA1 family [Amycolatopsis sacchari]